MIVSGSILGLFVACLHVDTIVPSPPTPIYIQAIQPIKMEKVTEVIRCESKKRWIILE